MRKLIAYTMSAACLACAPTAIAADRGQPLPRIIPADDGSAYSGPVNNGNTTSSGSATAGWVRGHGKIDSPHGALVANPQAAGKADIQFDCSLATAGATPSGSTHFRFQSGGLDFRATSYDLLVISGSSVGIGGAGTVNRAAGFRFSLSAIRGAPSRLRMRSTRQSTGAVVYDSQIGDDETAPATAVLGTGWIDISMPAAPLAQKIARATETTAAPTRRGAPPGFELAQNFPNPFEAGTCVRFTLAERSHLKLMVVDIEGRHVATLAVGAWDAGSHVVGWSGRTDADQPAPRGIYFLRMTAGLMSGEQRFASIRKMVLAD